MKSSDGSFDPTLTPEQVAETAIDTGTSSGSESVIRPSQPSLAGYRIGELLGRGGMGEVMLAEDLRIGRDVAIKRLRHGSPSNDALARFLREAKIQARLDHPAIVPVHELGHDAEGRPYFTMKRLAGTTLLEVMDGNQASQQKLLRAFVDVCLAIDFAHARGFIHRDLKPANVVLGDYGEVYVLDWGLARAIGGPDEPHTADLESLGGDSEVGTEVGAMMGTPGYMSPEQVRGEPVDTATDVYALGAMLFEILTGRALHPRGQFAVAATLAGGTLSPSQLAPDRNVPPELDMLCTEALAEAAEHRPSVRALADRAQQFLDGDRDHERRRALAVELLATARADLDSGDPDRRANAMRTAGRALALDPESEAAALVSAMMLEPPKVMPPALAETLATSELAQARIHARLGARVQLSYYTFAPLLLWMGIREWSEVVGLVVLITAAMLSAFAFFWRPKRFSIVITLGLNAVLMVVLCRLTSPVLIAPGVVAFAATSFVVFPSLIDRPWISLCAFVGGLGLVLGLEASGAWAQSWEVTGGQFVAHPPMVAFDDPGATVFVIASAFAVVIVLPLFVRSISLALRNSRRQLEIQAWHLGQLIPETRSRSIT